LLLRRQVSPEEFDAVCHSESCPTHPAGGGGGGARGGGGAAAACRQLQRAAGDARGGAALLRDLPTDRAEKTIAALAATRCPAGRVRLGRLAEAARRQFEPLVAQARRVAGGGEEEEEESGGLRELAQERELAWAWQVGGGEVPAEAADLWPSLP
jgi:hypothetical protein